MIFSHFQLVMFTTTIPNHANKQFALVLFCMYHTLLLAQIPRRNLTVHDGSHPTCFCYLMVFMICTIGMWIYKMGMSLLHNGCLDFEQWLSQVDPRRPMPIVPLQEHSPLQIPYEACQWRVDKEFSSECLIAILISTFFFVDPILQDSMF